MRITGLILAPALMLASTLAASAGDPAVLERGRYLVEGPAACGNCHTAQTPAGPDLTRKLGGQLVEETEHFTAYAPNITPGGRVGTWSDEAYIRAIREGIRPDGSVIGPPMPIELYRELSDEDVGAMVAYLRTVPPVDAPHVASQYRIPLPPAYGPPVESIAPVEPGVTVAYGAYLAGPVAHCTACHTPLGAKGPKYATDLGRGGNTFRGPWGVSLAPNITSHEDGLKSFSDEEIERMIAKGVRPDGSRMAPPMGYHYYANLDAQDLDAIVLYLRSLPPLPDVPSSQH
jgi:mono/diheme cytochrome c family protein